ncbi:MAG: flavin reductase [Clostridia bacterium]|nr:flavin reductase [Clostridia bacterium]
MENNSMFKISYGLFVLTAKDHKDNGCIINTMQQVTQEPLKISIAVNKQNYTHDMIIKKGEFNVSVLTESVPFEVIERFGFHSGRDTDKFEGCNYASETENGIKFIEKYSNAVISGKVIETVDCGTHTLFIADVTEAKVLSDEPSLTYQYYFDHIKPKPQAKKKGYVCKICGYVYEGEELPDDFICPLCKHPASDFEEIV